MKVSYDPEQDAIAFVGHQAWSPYIISDVMELQGKHTWSPYVILHEYVTVEAPKAHLESLRVQLTGVLAQLRVAHQAFLAPRLLPCLLPIVDDYLDRGADLIDVIRFKPNYCYIIIRPLQAQQNSYLFSLVMHEAWNELPAIHKSRDLKRCVHQLLAWGKEAPSYEPPEVRDKARRFVQAALRKKMRTLSDLYLTTATCCGDYIAYAYEMQEVQALIERFS